MMCPKCKGKKYLECSECSGTGILLGGVFGMTFFPCNCYNGQRECRECNGRGIVSKPEKKETKNNSK